MPRRIEFSVYQERWIISNCKTMTAADLARRIGVDPATMRRWLDKRGLKLSQNAAMKLRNAKMIGRTSFTAEEDAYIKQHALTLPVKTIARNLGRASYGVFGRLKALGITIPKEIIQARIKQSLFKPGQPSHNKGKKMPPEVYEKVKHTMFKRGNLPYNTKHDGYISVRHYSDGTPYKMIRMSKGKWEFLARYKWELFNGPIPEGHIIYHINGDPMDCSINNLGMMTYQDNMKRNSIQNYPSDIRAAINTLTRLNKKIKSHAQK